MPIRVFPRAADGCHELEPRDLGGNFLEFLPVAKLPGAAAALNAVELMRTGQSAAAFPVAIKGANVGNERSDARDRGKQQMVRAATLHVEAEAALRYSAAQHRIAGLELVKVRSEFALRHKFDEKFEMGLVRRGDDGIGALDPLAVNIDAEGGVLPGIEF